VDIRQFNFAAVRVRFIPVSKTCDSIKRVSIVINANPPVERTEKEAQKGRGEPRVNSL